ncbi:MAG: hypothetical protein KatS3mg082_3005 [Nitrospiraceae bacterium]|nr:MAG: hypothetical protein KatS3mg082_3005 [Nitrospiraceae bacterium]
MLLGLAACPLVALVRWLQGVLQGFHRPFAAQVPQFITVPSVTLVLCWFLHVTERLNALSAVSAYAGANLLALSFGGGMLLKVLPKGRQSRTPHARTHTARWVNSAVPLFLAAGASLVNDRIGVLLLGTFSTRAEAGLFDLATRAAGLVVFPLVAVNMVTAPVVASLHATRQRERMEETLIRAARLALVPAVVIAAVLIAFAPLVLGLLGPEFARAASALRIMCLGQVVNAASGPVALVLNMTGHERVALSALLVALGLNGSLAGLLIGPWGAIGAAVASAVSVTVWNLLLLAQVIRRLGTNPTAFRSWCGRALYRRR